MTFDDLMKYMRLNNEFIKACNRFIDILNEKKGVSRSFGHWITQGPTIKGFTDSMEIEFPSYLICESKEMIEKYLEEHPDFYTIRVRDTEDSDDYTYKSLLS
jgi:hypothetical protein